MPHIQDLLDALNGSAWYSSLNLASGYWQIEVTELDKLKTAFTTPYDLIRICIMVYLDDINIYSHTFEDHLQHLTIVFEWLQTAGLTLKPSKCFFS